MSNSQTSGLWRKFRKKKKIDIMRFTDIDVNFDVRYEGHQNWSKILSMDILMVFSDHLYDVEIDINICKPHCVNLIFL